MKCISALIPSYLRIFHSNTKQWYLLFFFVQSDNCKRFVFILFFLIQFISNSHQWNLWPLFYVHDFPAFSICWFSSVESRQQPHTWCTYHMYHIQLKGQKNQERKEKTIDIYVTCLITSNLSNWKSMGHHQVTSVISTNFQCTAAIFTYRLFHLRNDILELCFLDEKKLTAQPELQEVYLDQQSSRDDKFGQNLDFKLSNHADVLFSVPFHMLFSLKQNTCGFEHQKMKIQTQLPNILDSYAISINRHEMPRYHVSPKLHDLMNCNCVRQLIAIH